MRVSLADHSIRRFPDSRWWRPRSLHHRANSPTLLTGYQRANQSRTLGWRYLHTIRRCCHDLRNGPYHMLGGALFSGRQRASIARSSCRTRPSDDSTAALCHCGPAARSAMTDEANCWHFPAVCPHCSAKAGTPVRISECTDKVIAIVVRCDRCKSEWNLTSNSPPLLLKRKPDRRVSK